MAPLLEVNRYSFSVGGPWTTATLAAPHQRTSGPLPSKSVSDALHTHDTQRFMPSTSLRGYSGWIPPAWKCEGDHLTHPTKNKCPIVVYGQAVCKSHLFLCGGCVVASLGQPAEEIRRVAVYMCRGHLACRGSLCITCSVLVWYSFCVTDIEYAFLGPGIQLYTSGLIFSPSATHPEKKGDARWQP